MNVERAAEKIDALLVEGSQFSFITAFQRSANGYISAMSPAWISWTTRVQGAIERMFHPGSAPTRAISDAAKIELVGYGPTAFSQALNLYIGALSAAQALVKEDTFGELVEASTAIATKDLTNKVFVVHGHDDQAKADLEILLTEMGLEPVVLHRQADGGKTIIEKFEAHADVGFVFIILTPDEVTYLAAEEKKPDSERAKELRARPNVIFEFGYFVGRLGRARTCCLYRGDVVLPSDLSGLIYKRFDRTIEEVAYGIRKELRAAGYKLKD